MTGGWDRGERAKEETEGGKRAGSKRGRTGREGEGRKKRAEARSGPTPAGIDYERRSKLEFENAGNGGGGGETTDGVSLEYPECAD